MKNLYEIYSTEEDFPKQSWVSIYNAVLSLAGPLRKFKIIVVKEEQIVRFFLESNSDLSSIGNSLDTLFLADASTDALESLPDKTTPKKKKRWLIMPVGNILDLSEKLKVKKNLVLKSVVFNVRTVNVGTSIVKLELNFTNQLNQVVVAKKRMFNFPAHLLAIDFSTNPTYLKKSLPKYLDIEKSTSIFSTVKTSELFKVDAFPYMTGDYYINLTDYAFDKHSLIVGASGSGKSKLISLMVDRLANTVFRDNYRVIIIDPHNSLKEDMLHVPQSEVINFGESSTELFSSDAADVQASTELTSMLFKGLIKDQYNAHLDRTLRFTLYVLFTAQAMSLDNLKRFLTDTDFRTQILNHVKGHVPTNIQHFFGSDFNEIRTKYYNEAIVPVVSLIDEMQLQPGMTSGELSLKDTIVNNYLTIFSLNKVSMGEKVVKTVAGLLIQQIFLIAQSRELNKKILLIIDEVSIVQNPALAQILAEARKFNLHVMMAQQYFTQVDKSLRDAMFANVANYYTFRVSEEDARLLEGNMEIKLPKSIVEAEHKRGVDEKETRVKIITELDPRELLLRVSANGKLLPCVKARTVDANFLSQEKPHRELEKLKNAQKAGPGKFVEGHSIAAKDFSQPTQTEQQTQPLPSAHQPVGEVTQKHNVDVGQPASAKAVLEKLHNAQQSTTPPPLQSQSEEPLVESAVPLQSQPDTPAFNLSALLAEHSSSRRVVNPRKVGKK